MKIVLIALILIGLVIAAVLWQSRQYREFLANADKISGTLALKQVRNFRPNQQTGKENWVLYSFQLNGKEYNGEEKVEYADLWHQLVEGQAVDIYYNKGNPKESHLVVVLDRRQEIDKKLTGKAAE